MINNKIDTILILSGGNSSRFKPLSHKNLMLFNGQSLIDHQLRHYSHYTDNLIVVVNEETKDHIEAFARQYKAHLVLQKGSGQGAAVLSAKPLVKGQTLIANGNDLYHESLLQELLKKRAVAETDGFFVSMINKDYMPGGYLVLRDGYVAGVVEKPQQENLPSPYYKLVVDYIRHIDEFIKVLEKSDSAKDDLYEVALTSYIASGKKFKNVVYKSDWATMKYPWHVLDAMSFFLKEVKQYIGRDVIIDPTAKIIGDVYIDNGVKVYEYSKIVGPCYIGKNSIVGNYVLINQSMVGERSVIGGYTELTRSYIGDNVWTHRAYIGDSVVEGNANFAAGSVTANYRFDKAHITCRVKGKKTDTYRNKLGLIAGRGVQLGANAATMPGVMLGSGSLVQPGHICSRDM